MVLHSGTDRDGANGSSANNNNNNGPLPNPPIHPTLADVLAQQTHLLGHIFNQLGNAGNQGHRAEPQLNKFGEFFRTNPPIFRGSKDPLDADFWLNVIEEKLVLLNVSHMRRFSLPLTNFKMPQGLGGGISRLLIPQITASHGRSSERLFASSIFLRVSWILRRRNS